MIEFLFLLAMAVFFAAVLIFDCERKHGARYRIIRYGSLFQVQKRSLIGFWGNCIEMDGSCSGAYLSLDSAKEAISRHRARPDKPDREIIMVD